MYSDKLPKYINVEDAKYSVRVPSDNTGSGQRVRLGRFNSLEEALQVRDTYLQGLSLPTNSSYYKSGEYVHVDSTTSVGTGSVVFNNENNQYEYSYIPCRVQVSPTDSTSTTNKQAFFEVLNYTTTEPNIDTIWEDVIAKQTQLSEIRTPSNGFDIKINEKDKPFGIVFISDIHFGGSGVDYLQIKKDTDVILNTPGLYAVSHGDFLDNFVIGKLMGLQKNQMVDFNTELALAKHWLKSIEPKLIALVSGNHDLWTLKLSGMDFVKSIFDANIKFIYDEYQVVLNLMFGDEQTKVVKIRHQWKGSSVTNPTYGIENSWDKGGNDFDIGVGGHTHIATLFRPFIKHNKMRYAVLTGTYKTSDVYQKELGVAPTFANGGSGAIIFYPDGKMAHFDDLQIAADFLTWIRNK